MEPGVIGQGHQKAPSLPAYVHQEDVATFVTSHNKFTRTLYKKLGEKSSGNLFFSPFSIMTALGMTYTGAAGNTEQEMQSVMQLTQDKEAIHNAFQDIVSDLKTEASEYELRTSNMAYISTRFVVLTDYVNTLREKYLSSLKSVDFEEAECIRLEINKEVEKETNSRIKDLIPSDSIDKDTMMVLVNAVYFKGLWEHPFKTKHTVEKEFWTSETECPKIPMMYISEDFGILHHEDIGAKFLAMNYKGSRMSMVFVLPDKRDGLAEVEAKLAKVDLSEIIVKSMNLFRVGKVEVTLPKFKLEESFELVDYLKEMGMKDLFHESKCDLTGASNTVGIYVSNMFHKSFLEVNEEGSEAAAATGMMYTQMCCIIPEKFVMDHPFCFFIKDHLSGLILFAGRFIEP